MDIIYYHEVGTLVLCMDWEELADLGEITKRIAASGAISPDCDPEQCVELAHRGDVYELSVGGRELFLGSLLLKYMIGTPYIDDDKAGDVIALLDEHIDPAVLETAT